MTQPRSDPPAVTAAVIIIGNEVLSGRTDDANLNYIARALQTIGIRLIEARVVRDVEAAIVAAVNELREGYNRFYVLEKEIALRSAHLARQGFRPLAPATTVELAAVLPLLPVPLVVG